MEKWEKKRHEDVTYAGEGKKKNNQMLCGAFDEADFCSYLNFGFVILVNLT